MTITSCWLEKWQKMQRSPSFTFVQTCKSQQLFLADSWMQAAAYAKSGRAFPGRESRIPCRHKPKWMQTEGTTKGSETYGCSFLILDVMIKCCDPTGEIGPLWASSMLDQSRLIWLPGDPLFSRTLEDSYWSLRRKLECSGLDMLRLDRCCQLSEAKALAAAQAGCVGLLLKDVKGCQRKGGQSSSSSA